MQSTLYGRFQHLEHFSSVLCGLVFLPDTYYILFILRHFCMRYKQCFFGSVIGFPLYSFKYAGHNHPLLYIKKLPSSSNNDAPGEAVEVTPEIEQLILKLDLAFGVCAAVKEYVIFCTRP